VLDPIEDEGATPVALLVRARPELQMSTVLTLGLVKSVRSLPRRDRPRRGTPVDSTDIAITSRRSDISRVRNQ
jgi:hypothetical protein